MTYANLLSRPYIDENRYQTIGRGHGFSELDGVPFKISEKYQYTKPTFDFDSENIYQLSSTQAIDMASACTFQLEMKVLKNMANIQQRF
uniref:UMA domain-containing protein n=1 Tax=Arion vulgaris TaxID=1028688 RepID=A0A0B6ZQD0_9EUPU